MILPTANVLTSWPPTDKSEIHTQVAHNLDKLAELHHSCYVLVTSPLFGSHEQAAVSLLQEAFLGKELQFIPLHSSKECLQCMLNITRVTSAPVSKVIQQRVAALKEEMKSEESILGILRRVGLSESEGVMVLDGCGGISAIARASYEDLVDLNLSPSTVVKLMKLLHSQPEQ